MNHGLSVLSAKCRDTQDIVSIALNTSGVPLTFKGEVRSQEDILRIFASISIASGDVGPFTLEGRKLERANGAGNTVSWMKEPALGSYDEWPQSSLANTITRVEHEYIELDLYVFAGLPTMATQSSMDTAAAILAKHHLEDTFGNEKIGRNSPDAYFSPLFDQKYASLSKNFGQTCLAVAIDCGIDWIRRFPAIVQDKTAPPPPFGSIGVPDSDTFLDVASRLLSALGITKDNREDFVEDYLTPTTHFLTCIADRNLKRLSTLPRRIRTGEHDFALTIETINRFWFAVPVALSRLPFWVKRAWIVESFDPAASPGTLPSDLVEYLPEVAAGDGFMSDRRGYRAARNDERGTWRLRNTQVLYGCQPIVPDDKSVFLVKRQRVYGTDMRLTDGVFFFVDDEGWPTEFVACDRKPNDRCL